jgi:urease accessory protein
MPIWLPERRCSSWRHDLRARRAWRDNPLWPLQDHWRIRRNGRLVFAGNPRFDWADGELLSRPAVLGGGAAMATMLLMATEPECHLQPLRDIFAGAGGASAWNGKLLARVTAEGGAALRRILLPGVAPAYGRRRSPQDLADMNGLA